MRLFLVCLNIYSTTWESDRKERNVSSVCWFLSSDPLVYVGAGLGALVLIFTVVLFIFIKLKQKRHSSGLTSSAHRPDSLTYTSPTASAQSDSLNYSSVQFIRKPRCSVKTCEMFEMNPNEWAETVYSPVRTQHQSHITDPNSVIYSSLCKGL